jgi:hypothetical protein
MFAPSNRVRSSARTLMPEKKKHSAYRACVLNVVRHIRETRNEQEIENDLHTTDIDTELFLC